MNMFRSIQKLTQRLEKNQKPILVALMALTALTLLVGVLVEVTVGALVGALVALVLQRILERELDRALARERERAQETKEKKELGLILPPGARLRDVLCLIYSRKTVERVFEQGIADTQEEWQAAMIHNQPWLARWAQVHGVLTVFLTMAVHAAVTLRSILKLVR